MSAVDETPSGAARETAAKRIRRFKAGALAASAATLGAFTWQAAASSGGGGSEQALVEVPQPHADQAPPAPAAVHRRVVKRVSSAHAVHVVLAPATTPPSTRSGQAQAPGAPQQQQEGDAFTFPTSAPS